MKTLRLAICLFLLSAICMTGVLAYAAVPHLINYQGRLTDGSGVPLSGLYSITFRIYDAENAGNLLWQGTYSSVSITKGVFNILLGDVNDSGFNFSNLAFDKPYWLEIKVGADNPMQPRQMITSAGYAITAKRAEVADTVKQGSIDLAALATSVAPYLVPKGTIVMWSGNISAIPSGWALCDGNNSTPDLKNRFIFGAGGSVGGNPIVPGNKNSSYQPLSYSNGEVKTLWPREEYAFGPNQGNGVNYDNGNFIPPYYALAFIMKL